MVIHPGHRLVKESFISLHSVRLDSLRPVWSKICTYIHMGFLRKPLRQIDELFPAHYIPDVLN